MLQSVFALERLLELNDTRTFPRTLTAFHVGREIVFPTRDDLKTRRHLIDCRTAKIFYDTLNYYEVFLDVYDKHDPFGALEEVGRYVSRDDSEGAER